ncbi:MAG: ABC transporter ATP-binding protein [Notoacmeibacter sp.]|nr:ABC transporter ATP-binding protein [Notoacmeibacter sp.]
MTDPAPQTEAPLLLDIRDLWIEAVGEDGVKPIVKGISLHLRPGEVLGLIGESGAGKSTLGLAAMGYARPGCRITRGSIRFKGQELLGLTETQLTALRGRCIAYVAQSAAAAFNPAHRLIDQITETAIRSSRISRDQAESRARDLLRRMHFNDPDAIGRRYPHQVSGGQLQRLMTAMAMVADPDIIIFDEPTTALDVTTQIGVLASIREVIRDLGKAAIYITHDLALVAQMADRIKVLRYGSEVEEAPTRVMLSDPREDYTRSLWAVRRFRKTNDGALKAEAPVLEIRQMSAGYGNRTVIQDIDLAVGARETLAIVGESGSGKSTTAQVICGLLAPSNGALEFQGAPLSPDRKGRSRQQLRDIQMVFQMPDTALNPRQRVRDIVGRPVELFLGLRGKQKDDRVGDILSMIGMEPGKFIDRFPHELSGGQKQRIAIARALVCEPKLVICDEVTSSLDQLVAEEILMLLDRTRKALGLSYVFVSHDLETVRAIADRVVVMSNGRIVEQGATDSIFASPENEYTRLLLASVPEMNADWLTRRLSEFTEIDVGPNFPPI